VVDIAEELEGREVTAEGDELSFIGDDSEIDSGTLLFKRIIEVIGNTCEETGDLTKYQIVGALECVKHQIIEGLHPESEIDEGGKPEDN
jgi:hypothetical protein